MVDDFYKSLERGFVLYACPYQDESDIEFAREYCRENNLSHDEFAIRIIYSDQSKTKKEMVIVIKK